MLYACIVWIYVCSKRHYCECDDCYVTLVWYSEEEPWLCRCCTICYNPIKVQCTNWLLLVIWHKYLRQLMITNEILTLFTKRRKDSSAVPKSWLRIWKKCNNRVIELASEYRHKGCNAPSVRESSVEGRKVRLGHWLTSLLYFL